MTHIGRRRLLAGGIALIGAAALNAARAAAPLKAAPTTLLVLGGTGFVGPHIVEAALKRGHKVTLFNRGKTNPGLFPQLEKLTGDRNTDLKALEGRAWDAVIDTSGITPGEVERSATLLASNVGQYVYLSSVSVYAESDRAGLAEDAPLAGLDDPLEIEHPTPENAGALKALGERAAERAFPGRSVALRSGVLAGPGDPTDRFTFWPARVARGGEVLLPGAPEDPLQFLDARDLADFAILAIERKLTGAYNVDAQPGAITVGKLFEACRRVAAPSAKAVYLPATFLATAKVSRSELPLWQPPREFDSAAAAPRVDATKAKAAGLKYRTLEQTARDTLEWWRAQPDDRRAALRAGLAPEREAELLAGWRLAQGAKA